MTAEIIDCGALGNLFQGFTLNRDCDIIGENTLRISTPFLYPDGSFIDLFLEQSVALDNKAPSPLYSGYILSDLGETGAYLFGQRIKLGESRKRERIVSGICRTLDVECQRGQLQVKLEADELSSLPDAIIRLAQACVRVADLTLVKRQAPVSSLAAAVERTLRHAGLPYERPYFVQGRYDRDVQVDFRVKGATKESKDSLVKTISPSTPEAAHIMFNEALARWVSLSGYRSSNRLLTVIQDRAWQYRQDDIARLKDFSDGVISFPSGRDDFLRMLAS